MDVRVRERGGRFSKSKPVGATPRRLDHKGAFHDRHGVWGAAVSQRVDLIEVAARTRARVIDVELRRTEVCPALRRT